MSRRNKQHRIETAVRAAEDAVSHRDHALALLTLEVAHRDPVTEDIERARSAAIADAILRGVMPSAPDERLRWHHSLDSVMRRSQDTPVDVEVALARIERARDQRARALIRLRALVERSPDDPDVALALAESLADEVPGPETLTVARRAVELNPGSALARWILGDVLLRQGQASEALAHLEAASEVLQSDPRVPRSLGLAYGMLQDWDRARTALERAVALNPEDAQTHHDLGEAYARTNRLRLAAGSFQTAWNLGRNLDAYRSLGRIALSSGDRDLTARVFGEVVERSPGDAEATFVLGHLAQSAGRTETARAYFESCVLRSRAHVNDAAFEARCAAALSDLPAATSPMLPTRSR
jgi:tetratricopeptide (TPR) repeat protein